VLDLIACKHSNAISALSVIILPGIKALWLGEIMSCNAFGHYLITDIAQAYGPEII
jgi:hypothetical protein